MTDRELMQQALDALEYAADEIGCPNDDDSIGIARKALRARLAQPKEPDWSAAGFGKPSKRECADSVHDRREWQTMTENEIKHLWYEACQTNLELTSQLIVHLARNIESKLKEKNT